MVIDENEFGVGSARYESGPDEAENPATEAVDQFTSTPEGEGPDSGQRPRNDRRGRRGKRSGTGEGADPERRDRLEEDVPPSSDEPGASEPVPEGGAQQRAGEGKSEARASRKRKKRSKRKAGRADRVEYAPGREEVLNRLMEKNEVILQLTKKNVDLEANYKSLEDKRLRTLAEFENYRKRTQKEWSLLREQSRAEVILEILNVVDDFERAFSVVGEREDDFVQGIRLIYNNMLSTLAKFGVTKMEAQGQPFDPNFHMAVAHIDTDTVESNHVVEVIQEGYMMNDSVIRAANVVIAK